MASQKVPQVLLDGAELGDDHFQIRSLVLGKAPPSAPKRVVEVAAWGNTPSASAPVLGEASRVLDRLAVAQRVLL
jgi:hypothetical protein